MSAITSTRRLARCRVGEQRDAAHGAELDAQQINRGACEKAAQRLVEHHAHADRLAVVRREGAALLAEQAKALSDGGRLSWLAAVRYAEGNAAGEHRRDRLGVDRQ